MATLDKMKTEIVKMETQIKSIVVRSAQQRTAAIDAIKAVKEKRAEIVEFFKDSKEKAHSAWKAIVANEKSFTDKMDAFEKQAKAAISVFDNEQERVRAAEEARLREKADADAETERKRLEGIAKRTKDVEKRDELLSRADAVAPAMVSLPSKIETQEGESKRKTWKARVVDFSLLPDTYKLANDSALRALATSAKGTAVVPGVEFYFEFSTAIRI